MKKIFLRKAVLVTFIILGICYGVVYYNFFLSGMGIIGRHISEVPGIFFWSQILYFALYLPVFWIVSLMNSVLSDSQTTAVLTLFSLAWSYVLAVLSVLVASKVFSLLTRKKK
jgi:hypothetical protein